MIDLAWSDPVDNGTPITGYRIFIQETVAGDYQELLTECDGSSQTVVDARACTISLTTLRSEPFNLILLESVSVKIISQNVLGDSPISEAGDGAVIWY